MSADGRVVPLERVVAVAWLTITIVAAVAIAAMLFLAPTVGDLIAPEPLDFFVTPVSIEGLIQPEHTELARVGFALLAAISVAAVVAYAGVDLGAGRLAGIAGWTARIGPYATVGALVVAWFARSEPISAGVREPEYFTWLAGLGAVVFAIVVVAVAVRPLRSLPDSWAVDGGRRSRRLAAVIALLATAAFAIPGAFTDASLADARPFILVGHLPGIFADFAAVGNGATPGVDFASQYANLLPYPLAPILALTDYSPGAFTIVATLLTSAALLALWRALVLATRSEVAGIALYLPVLAISVVPLEIVGDERLANNSQYQILPERYLLPCVLAWLLARHLRGLSPRRHWVLFLVAGLAALNNPEFGTPALLATFAGLAIAKRDGGSPLSELRPLLKAAAVGVGAAIVVACTVTLIRSGALPTLDLVLYYSRLFGSQGFGMQPMPTVGFGWIVYATFAGALILAAVRARAREADRGMTGILAFSGLFGLLVCLYYGGRTNSYSLNGLFPAWGFALALLTAIVWSRMRDYAEGWTQAARTAGPLGFAVLVGLGLAVSTILQVAAPWAQVSRIADHSTRDSPFDLADEERFVAEWTAPDEPVAFLGKNGFLIGRDVGFRNVALISDPVHVVSGEQMGEILAALREQGGEAVFTDQTELPPLHPEIPDYLRSNGFEPVAEDRATGLTYWRSGDSP